MEPDKHSRNIENIVEQIKQSFSSVYLTLISIIQASVLGYLVFIFGSQRESLSSISIIVSVTTFLMLVTTWNEYMMGSTVFRWIPRLRDSFLPFLIGISEFLVVHHTISDVSLWCYSMALFCFVGYLAYLNMHHSARLYPENTPIFERLGRLPMVTEIWAFCLAVVFSFLGIISHKFASTVTIQYVIAFLSVVVFGAFLYRGVRYWSRIVDTASVKK